MTGAVTVAVSVAIVVHRELEEDYVGVWKVPWHVRRALPQASDDQVRVVSRAVLEALLVRGATIGSLDETTGSFDSWDTRTAVDAAMVAWLSLGRDPNIGEVAWLAL